MEASLAADVIEDNIRSLYETLVAKQKEYNPNGEDVLRSFKTSAELQDTTVKVALRGYMTKHVVSIYDMIADGKDHPQGLWEEKVHDTINYLLLLLCIVHEEKSLDPGF